MQDNNPKFKSDLRQRCFRFSVNVIALSDKLPNKRSAWVISDQVIRSATSIGANLIEAKASSSRLEYKKFFEIALKSSNETQYWLELLLESKLMKEEGIRDLLSENLEISKMLGAGVIKLKERKYYQPMVD
jgi:four helix bundle protein